jgi:hypothetical protein
MLLKRPKIFLDNLGMGIKPIKPIKFIFLINNIKNIKLIRST